MSQAAESKKRVESVLSLLSKLLFKLLSMSQWVLKLSKESSNNRKKKLLPTMNK